MCNKIPVIGSVIWRGALPTAQISWSGIIGISRESTGLNGDRVVQKLICNVMSEFFILVIKFSSTLPPSIVVTWAILFPSAALSIFNAFHDALR